jgi:hypothetical protein
MAKRVRKGSVLPAPAACFGLLLVHITLPFDVVVNTRGTMKPHSFMDSKHDCLALAVELKQCFLVNFLTDISCYSTRRR